MSRNTGFTLLEVLVAITLASLLLTSIYGVFSVTATVKEQVEKQGAALHLGRVLIARLDRELLGLALENLNKRPAIAGGKNPLDEPFLELVTNSGGSAQPGMRQIRYRLGPDQNDQLTLWRAEKSLNNLTPATEEKLAQGITALTFSFYDGQDWRDQWDSLNNGRPILVRAELEFLDLDDKTPLSSIFDLPQKRRDR